MVCGFIGVSCEKVRGYVFVARVRGVEEVSFLVFEYVFPQAFCVADAALHVCLLDATPYANLDRGREALSPSCFLCVAVVLSLDRGEMEVETGDFFCDSFSEQFQSDEGGLGLPGVETDGVLVVVEQLLAGVLVGGVIDEVEEVDEGAQGDDELSPSEGDVLSGTLHVLVGCASVPVVAREAAQLEEDVGVLLVVSSDEVGCAVRDEPELPHQRVGLGAADVVEVGAVRGTQSGNHCFQVLQARVEDTPIGEGEGLDEGEGRTGVQAIVSLVELGPRFEDDVHPRFILELVMRLDFSACLVEVDEVVDHNFGHASSLDHSHVIVALLADGLRFNQAHEVPLGQHLHLAQVAWSVQPFPAFLLLFSIAVCFVELHAIGVDVPEALPNDSFGQFFVGKFELIILEELLVEKVC